MSKVAHQAGAYPGFCSMKRLGVFLLPLDGMLVHCSVTHSIKLAGAHLYTLVERGTVRLESLAQDHNTTQYCPLITKAQTQSSRSRVKSTNHETTAPMKN